MATDSASAASGDCWPCPGCNRLLTIQQVSERLQLPVQSIYKRRALGTFAPAYKIGKHLRWRCAELMEWFEERRDAV